VESDKHRAIALRAAQEGLVLLKNGEAGGALIARLKLGAQTAPEIKPRSGSIFHSSPDVLPWDAPAMSGQRVCVIGPLANDSAAVIGDYHPHPSRTIYTPLLGLQRRLLELDTNATIVFEVGCSNYTYCPDLATAAVQAAVRSCDRTVLALGLSARSMISNVSNACGCPEGDAIEGECCDRYSVGLPGQQGQLLKVVVEAAASARTPHRPVLFTNSAGVLDLSSAVEGPLADSVAAVLHGAFLSEAAGLALADAILGTAAPSGKLATTWYRDIGKAPGIKNYTALDRGYRTAPESNILFEFGFGLTGYGAAGLRYSHVFLYKYKPSPSVARALKDPGASSVGSFPVLRHRQEARLLEVQHQVQGGTGGAVVDVVEGPGLEVREVGEAAIIAGDRNDAHVLAPGVSAPDDDVPEPLVRIPACYAAGWTLALRFDDQQIDAVEAAQVYMVANHTLPGGSDQGRGRLVGFVKFRLTRSGEMFAS